MFSGRMLTVWLVTAVISTVVAAASYALVEVPSQRWLAPRRAPRGRPADGQLAGEHFLSALGRTEVEWTLFHADTRRDEPDYRRLTYFQPLDDPEQPYRLLIGSTVSINNGGRPASSRRGPGVRKRALRSSGERRLTRARTTCRSRQA